jgi:hypothetical protein
LIWVLPSFWCKRRGDVGISSARRISVTDHYDLHDKCNPINSEEARSKCRR